MRVIHSLEELKQLVGHEAGVSDWLQMTQERIGQFADATGDHQWIHVDPARARAESPYGATIAHGFLTLSLLPRLLSETLRLDLDGKMRINYGLNRLRFPAAVPAGARLRGCFVLASVEDFPGGVQLTWTVTVEIEGGAKPCVAAEWVTRQYF